MRTNISFNTPSIKDDYKFEGLFLKFENGESYEEINNGSNSALHWDLVLDLRTTSSGGKIWFDDKLVFCDGQWLK